MKLTYLSAITFFCILLSCKKIQIASDANYPDLPAYSQQGLNVGGVLINDTAWLTLPYPSFLSLSRSHPLDVISYPNGDSVVFIFYGAYKNTNLQNKWPAIYIVLKNIKIQSDSALTQLNDQLFILDGINNYGGFMDDRRNMSGKASGTIEFGKVIADNSITYGDGSPNNPKLHPYIISGQFNMKFSVDRKYTLTKGRFDIAILRGAQFGVVQ